MGSRTHVPLPTSLTYVQQRQTRRQEIVNRAYDDGTFVGFGLGVLASLLAWAILSGALMRAVMWAAWAWLTILDGRL